MRFMQRARTGPCGPFILFLAFTLAAIELVTALSLRDGSRSPFHLLARDDQPYPDDYPYPKKADIPPSVTTEKNKSLFYTLLGPKGGATSKQLVDFRISESLHVVGDTSFTIPLGFDDPKSLKNGNGEIDLKRTSDYYRRFVDDLSTVFADRSSGEVFLLLPLTIDGANPGQIACRTTWVRTAFDALKANSKVEKITQVDPGDFTKRKVIYPPTGSKPTGGSGSDKPCHDHEAGDAPNLAPPPTGYINDVHTASPAAAAAASQPKSQANPVCDHTAVTYTLSDTQRLANQLTTAGTDRCCTSPSQECAVVQVANSVSAFLCGPTGHAKQCTDCAKLGKATDDLNVDCQKNYRVGGKVAIPYLDRVTLTLQRSPSA